VCPNRCAINVAGRLIRPLYMPSSSSQGYTEARALLDVVRDWGMHRHADGKLYCAQCFKVMTCEMHGHTWEQQWLQSPDGNEQFRWCEHCGDTQVRPIEIVELP
jgi:hypothetical protein